MYPYNTERENATDDMYLVALLAKGTEHFPSTYFLYPYGISPDQSSMATLGIFKNLILHFLIFKLLFIETLPYAQNLRDTFDKS